MNYNCKYCDYVDKCSRKCEYDSILCKMNRSFPKIVKRPYKEILYENSDLKLENSILKQALIDIRELANNWGKEDCKGGDCYDLALKVVQIIDKAIGDEENDDNS